MASGPISSSVGSIYSPFRCFKSYADPPAGIPMSLGNNKQAAAFISFSVAVGFHPTTAKKHLFWMVSCTSRCTGKEWSVSNVHYSSLSQNVTKDVSNNPEDVFPGYKWQKKKSFLWKTSYSALHIVDKLGEEANMWFILLCRADCKAILISLSGGDGDQSIQMEAVFLRFLFNSNEKWQHSYYWPYRKMYRLLHFTLG